MTHPAEYLHIIRYLQFDIIDFTKTIKDSLVSLKENKVIVEQIIKTIVKNLISFFISSECHPKNTFIINFIDITLHHQNSCY
jgi:hypothetical protein